MLNKYSFYWFICFTVFFAGCKSSSVTTNNNTRSNKLKIKEFDFNYLSAKGKIIYKDGDKQQKANFDLRAKKDSAIWMSLRSGTGIEGVRVLITQDTAIMIDRLQKEYRKYSFNELSRRLKFDVDYKLFESILLGNVLKKYQKKMKSSKSDKYFILKREEERYQIELFINRELNKLQRAISKDEQNNNTLTLEYNNFKNVNENTFPFTLVATLVHQETNNDKNLDFNLNYSKVTAPDKPLKLPFRISSKYKRVIE